MTGKAGRRGMEGVDRAERSQSGKVWLVGAGCGGPELLTLRAAELLRACSCVVYDDLIDPAILDLAPPEAETSKRDQRFSCRSHTLPVWRASACV